MDFFAELIGSQFLASVIFMAFVGTIVSIDVTGLILSQYKDFATGQDNSPTNLKSPTSQALLHAFVHGGLFCAYMVVTSILARGFKEFMEAMSGYAIWFANLILSVFQLPFRIHLDHDALTRSIVLAVGVAIIILVWITYEEKIVEDHKSKVKDPRNPLSQQRADVRVIYWLLKKSNVNVERLLDCALALAVAVDMLAVSAVIRVYFEGTLDTGYKGFHIDFLGHEYFSKFSEEGRWLANVIVFSLGIFGMVFFWARRAGLKAAVMLDKTDGLRLFGFSMERINRYLDAKFGKKNVSGYVRLKLTLYRLLEPLLVFFVLSGALFHLLASPSELAIPGINLLFWQFALALWLLACLISLHGPRKIFKKVNLGIGFSAMRAAQKIQHQSGQPTEGAGSSTPLRRSLYEVLVLGIKAYAHLPIVLIFSLGVLVAFVASHDVRIDAPIVRFTNILSTYLGVAVFFALYAPLGAPDIEAHFERRYFQYPKPRKSRPSESKARFQTTATLAAIGVLFYMHGTFLYPDSFVLYTTKPFILGSALLLLLFSGASALTWYRRNRNRHLCLFQENRSLFSRYFASFGDYLTSLGMVCLCWQVVLLWNQLAKP